MEKVTKLVITGRNLNPKYSSGKIVGFRIFIPASFQGMLDPSKKYSVILEVEEGAEPDEQGS